MLHVIGTLATVNCAWAGACRPHPRLGHAHLPTQVRGWATTAPPLADSNSWCLVCMRVQLNGTHILHHHVLAPQRAWPGPLLTRSAARFGASAWRPRGSEPAVCLGVPSMRLWCRCLCVALHLHSMHATTSMAVTDAMSCRLLLCTHSPNDSSFATAMCVDTTEPSGAMPIWSPSAPGASVSNPAVTQTSSAE